MTQRGLVALQSVWVSKPFTSQQLTPGPTEHNWLADQYAVLASSLIYDSTPGGIGNLRHTARVLAGTIIADPVGYVEGGKQVGSYAGIAADQNLDGFIDSIDLDLFVGAWVDADPRGDFNWDGFVDAIDYDNFIRAWLGVSGMRVPGGAP